jgi:isochorismate pyruvate lyase
MTPAECTTREDIRREIDRLDRALIDLLAERFGYVRRMSEIKTDPMQAHDGARVNDVLAKVAGLGEARGLDAELVKDMWGKLMDWNIEWERQAIAARAAR